MHFLGIMFYSYTHVPYRNITHQHANMLEEKESWIMYFYKKSMYKRSLALDKLLLQLYICFRDGLRSKGTMLSQIGKEGKIWIPFLQNKTFTVCIFGMQLSPWSCIKLVLLSDTLQSKMTRSVIMIHMRCALLFFFCSMISSN